jgi:hypothetical protein
MYVVLFYWFFLSLNKIYCQLLNIAHCSVKDGSLPRRGRPPKAQVLPAAVTDGRKPRKSLSKVKLGCFYIATFMYLRNYIERGITERGTNLCVLFLHIQIYFLRFSPT